MSGLKLAVLFGLYPNQLGFCGSQKSSDKNIIHDWLRGKRIPEEKIKKILQGFEGAFPYYKLIAESNSIKDPFDERVVSAYWIGNNLLEKVSIADLRAMIVKEFSKRGLLSEDIAEKKAKIIPRTSIPHHSFHVLVMGSVTGRVVLKGKLLDLCRVSSGMVLKDAGSGKKVIIEYQPLQKKNAKYIFSRLTRQSIFLDKSFVPNVKIGDMVAIHWNHIVQILSERNLFFLRKCTKITMDSLNS